jgi:uncharacterized protein
MLPRPAAALALLALATTLHAQQPRPLANEKSAYLVSHASNPVLWHPWGEAAFAKAVKEEKPIFLSIGYASCHWCHVMERESFTNEEIAKAINANFIPILVDREEHPEVDATYIAFLQSMTGSAGWPANLILTPDLKPIIGGSYMKPELLTKLVTVIADRWKSDRKSLLASSEQLVQMTHALVEKPAPGELDVKVLEAIAADITTTYDKEHGGFGGAPKFPQAATISWLLRYTERTGNVQTRAMALDTLRRLANSGLHDQLGGGFHRYAVDAELRLPHFEKMLYDQALLAIAYTEAWQMTKDAEFERVARGILDYVLRDLRAAKTTAFASAHDSDTGHEEGAYYLWTRDEIRTVLGDDTDAALRWLGVTEERVLYVADPLQVSKSVKDKLLAARLKRTAPLRDDKVLTAWNGLIVSALARAGAAFNEPRYIDAASGAARFITTNLWNAKTKKLQRRWADGHAGIDALPEDYAFLIQGLLDLFETSYDVAWLDLASALQTQQDKLFWDANRYTGGTSVPAALRGVATESELALPAAASIAAMNLLRLGELTDSDVLRKRANDVFRSYATRLQNTGAELPALGSALLFAFSTPKQIVIAGDPKKDDTRALLRVVHERFIPNRILVLAPGGAAQAKLAAYMPVVKEMAPMKGRATAFVCEDYACKLPTSDPQKVAQLLE